MNIGLLGGSGQIGREILALAERFRCEVDAPASNDVDLAGQQASTAVYAAQLITASKPLEYPGR